MGRKELYPGSARKGTRARNTSDRSPANPQQSKLRTLSAPLHVWTSCLPRPLPSNTNTLDFVCPTSFFLPAPCTDRKCRRNHDITPLHEALPALPSSPTPKKKSSQPPLPIDRHAYLATEKDVKSFTLPSSQTLQLVVSQSQKIYSIETGFIAPPPSTPQPLPPSPPQQQALPPPFLVLPDDALLHLFLEYLPINAFGMVAITCKSLFAQFLRCGLLCRRSAMIE